MFSKTSRHVSDGVCVYRECVNACVRARESVVTDLRWGEPSYCVKMLLSSFPTGCLYVSDELLIINKKNIAVHMTRFNFNLTSDLLFLSGHIHPARREKTGNNETGGKFMVKFKTLTLFYCKIGRSHLPW